MPDLHVPTSDVIGLLWFLTLWIAYTWLTDRGRPREHSLRAVMHTNRERWMRELLKRDNRIMDTNILRQWGQGASFFASTSLLILAGVVGVLGATDEAAAALRQIPFTGRLTHTQWEVRLLLLIVIFVHAFFKCTWAMRQFNYCAVLVGAAPAEKNVKDEAWIKGTAWMSTLASKDFNQGMRAYYFGLAVLAWFFNAWVFMAATALVVAVLYHREYQSEALRTLELPSIPGTPAKRKS